MMTQKSLLAEEGGQIGLLPCGGGSYQQSGAVGGWYPCDRSDSSWWWNSACLLLDCGRSSHGSSRPTWWVSWQGRSALLGGDWDDNLFLLVCQRKGLAETVEVRLILWVRNEMAGIL
jgi:hypothetical protein